MNTYNYVYMCACRPRPGNLSTSFMLIIYQPIRAATGKQIGTLSLLCLEQ